MGEAPGAIKRAAYSGPVIIVNDCHYTLRVLFSNKTSSTAVHNKLAFAGVYYDVVKEEGASRGPE